MKTTLKAKTKKAAKATLAAPTNRGQVMNGAEVLVASLEREVQTVGIGEQRHQAALVTRVVKKERFSFLLGTGELATPAGVAHGDRERRLCRVQAA